MPGVEAVDGLVEVYRFECGGHASAADERMRDVLPLLICEMQSLPHYVGCAKHLLRQRRQLDCVSTRIAGSALSGRSRELLERYLRAAKLTRQSFEEGRAEEHEN